MNKMFFYIVLSAAMLFSVTNCSRAGADDYKTLIAQGRFSQAKEQIQQKLEKEDLSMEEQKKLTFELERMERIKKDFTATQDEVIAFIKQYIPDVDDQQLRKWEESRALEYRMINGEKRYFKYAARNLFRIDSECRAIWKAHHKDEPQDEAFDLDGHIKSVIQTVKESGQRYVKPVRLQIDYQLEVKSDAVPAGETIRCWIPFPREIPQRQTDIELLSSEPEWHQLAPNKALQRTVYFEKKAQAGKATRFQVRYAYTAYGSYIPIEPEKITAVDASDPTLKPYLKEEPPHIVFTPELRKLSGRILGGEQNPYRKAQKLFEWVDANIPWASAREYSTIRSLSMYPYENRHGDCGIQTMMFITLCRLNGIPARWQSGWEFKPPDDTMHDWGMIYFEPYGWMPMDITYGMRDSDDPELKWFYLSGMDSYRLIFNDAYSQPFIPAKEHYRSETVDSQRGEVEWNGGNLYFDQWDWRMQFKVLSK